MDDKTQSILDGIIGRNKKETIQEDFQPEPQEEGIMTFDDFIQEATNKAIRAAHDAVKPFPIPKKMLENIKNAVRPVMEEYLTRAYQMGEND